MIINPNNFNSPREKEIYEEVGKIIKKADEWEKEAITYDNCYADESNSTAKDYYDPKAGMGEINFNELNSDTVKGYMVHMKYDPETGQVFKANIGKGKYLLSGESRELLYKETGKDGKITYDYLLNTSTPQNRKFILDPQTNQVNVVKYI